SPTLRAAVLATSDSVKGPLIDSCTYTREQALHFCPCRTNDERITPPAAASRSAEGMMMAGFFPPISVMQGFGYSLLNRWRIDIPTAFQPVNNRPSTSGRCARTPH